MKLLTLMICNLSATLLGTGVRGLTTGLTTLTQGNQEPLVVKDKVGRLPGELGESKCVECDTFPFSALTVHSLLQLASSVMG